MHAETARALHATAAHVIMAVRDVSRGQEVAQEIQASKDNGAKFDILKLELDSLDSIRSCATEFLKLHQPLNILINNAGADATLLCSV